MEDVPGSLSAALTLLAERARENPELGAAFRTVLTEALTRLPEPEPELVPEPLPVPDEEPEPAHHLSPDSKAQEETELVAEPEPAYAEWPDLGEVAANLELKARASRWVARHGYTEERDALVERYALLDEARSAECYLWMFDRNRVDPFQSGFLTELAELFELAAAALALWQEAADTPKERDADTMLAEVQAALRVTAYTAARWRDPDQYALFQALRLSGQASRTFFPQLSLGYSPRTLEELQAQLQALEEAKARREAREQTVSEISGKARECVALVVEKPAVRTRWRKLYKAVRELEALGEDVMDLLAPLRGLTVPDELPELAARLALPEPVPVEATPVVDAPSPSVPSLDAPSPDVRRVRALLQGREVVIVGGEVRREAVEGLEAAFGCSVRWLDAAPHTSLSVFEPAITEEVAVVLLLIRWSSHVYGELVHVCKARGVPLVRLAGGYNPNRVAHDVLEQAEERLRRFQAHQLR